MLDRGTSISFDQVRELVFDGQQSSLSAVVSVAAPQISEYDALLVSTPVVSWTESAVRNGTHPIAGTEGEKAALYRD